MKIWSNKSSKIASVLPISWFSKFKTKGNDSEISSVNKERLDFPTPNGKIYNMHEDDAYWSLSFRKDDRVEGRRSTGGINSLSSYIDRIDEVQVPVGGQNRNFDDMVLDFKKLKEKQHKERISRKNDEGDRVIFAIEPEDTVKNGAKYKDIRVKTESYGKKVRKNNGAKSYSPRTECKIKAIEEMRKAKMKKKKLPKEQGKTVFDSFAVVKSSVNPHRDFRDSMVEMIIEKGIRRPRELEKLLACYLELNSDEYHHLIIKVFRQVWFDLNGMYADQVMHE